MGPDWSQMTLGARLKYLREKKLRMSGYELVSELQARGVPVSSHTTVYRYEQGKRMPPADYVAGLADLAGVSVDDILRGSRNGAVRLSAQEAEDRDLVAALRDVAHRRGWTQARLAERVDVPATTLSRWLGDLEAGAAPRLSPEHREAIRAYLARSPAATEEEIEMLARQRAAQILEEVAAQLRTHRNGAVRFIARSEDEEAHLDRLAEAAARDAREQDLSHLRKRADNG